MTARNITHLENSTKHNLSLRVEERLYILSCGGKLRHTNSGGDIWVSNGVLTSDTIKWISSLPKIIFDTDIEFTNINHL